MTEAVSAALDEAGLASDALERPSLCGVAPPVIDQAATGDHSQPRRRHLVASPLREPHGGRFERLRRDLLGDRGIATTVVDQTIDERLVPAEAVGQRTEPRRPLGPHAHISQHACRIRRATQPCLAANSRIRACSAGRMLRSRLSRKSHTALIVAVLGFGTPFRNARNS